MNDLIMKELNRRKNIILETKTFITTASFSAKSGEAHGAIK